jgi:hypothetical protein|tara:strand:+ start:674 stop:883 length:210 start_codon:yes stop_codon:yes gene_type:complete
MITRKVTNRMRSDVERNTKRVTNIDQQFRAKRIVQGENIKYVLDFGPDTPQIELVVNGDYIDAQFVVTE